jgi:hypothetical protein
VAGNEERYLRTRVYVQASGEHGAAQIGGRAKLHIPVAVPVLPPDAETLAPVTPVHIPQPSVAAVRLARQAMGSASKRATVAAGRPGSAAAAAAVVPSSTSTSGGDGGGGGSHSRRASAAVAAVAASSSGAAGMGGRSQLSQLSPSSSSNRSSYSSSPPPLHSMFSRDGNGSFAASSSLPLSGGESGGLPEDVADFMAFNVIMSPPPVGGSSSAGGGSSSSREGGGAIASLSKWAVSTDVDGSDVGGAAAAAAAQTVENVDAATDASDATDTATAATAVGSSDGASEHGYGSVQIAPDAEVAEVQQRWPRAGGRRRKQRQQRPQSAPAAAAARGRRYNRKAAAKTPTLRAWDEVEQPLFGVNGLGVQAAGVRGQQR